MIASLATTALTQFLDIGGTRFAYRRFGARAGTPLVCTQHFTGNLDNFDPAISDALAARREIILFDNAGVGRCTGTAPHTTLNTLAACPSAPGVRAVPRQPTTPPCSGSRSVSPDCSERRRPGPRADLAGRPACSPRRHATHEHSELNGLLIISVIAVMAPILAASGVPASHTSMLNADDSDSPLADEHRANPARPQPGSRR